MNQGHLGCQASARPEKIEICFVNPAIGDIRVCVQDLGFIAVSANVVLDGINVAVWQAWTV
jgi:hypothetical protein